MENVEKHKHQRGETRRDRRIQRKREEILGAATRVFARKGFVGATTKDIADEADIGESTLYDYFDSKRDMLLAVIDEHRSIFDSLLQETVTLANREGLINLVDHGLEKFTSRVSFLRTILTEAWMDDEIFEKFLVVRMRDVTRMLTEFTIAQAKNGTLRPFDPALVARLTLGMFFSLVMPVLRGIEPPPTPEQRRAWAEALVTLLMDGICIPQQKEQKERKEQRARERQAD